MAMIWRGFYFYRRRMDRRRVLRALALSADGSGADGGSSSPPPRCGLCWRAWPPPGCPIPLPASSARPCMRPSRRASCSTTAWCPLRRTRRATSPLCSSNMAAFNHLQAEILDTVLTRIEPGARPGAVHPHRQPDGFGAAGGTGAPDHRADGVRGLVGGQLPQRLHLRRHQPDQAPDHPDGGCLCEHPAAGLHAPPPRCPTPSSWRRR